MRCSKIWLIFICLGFILVTIGLLGAMSGVKNPIFPDKEWKRRTPKAAGIDENALSKIDSVMKVSRSNGVLIKDGHLVSEWNYAGPSSKKIEVQSITKSLSSMVLGLALKEGKIPNLDVLVKDYYPAFEAGPYTSKITFRHLVTATSGMKAVRHRENYQDPNNMAPGVKFIYTNDHTAELCGALTYIYKESLLNIVKSRVLNVIGAEVEWGLDKKKVKLPDGKELDVVAGYAFSKWTAQDLARFGWLYLNGGKWKGKQLISAEYAAESRRQIVLPFDGNIPEGQSAMQKTPANYGLAWRCMPTKEGGLLWYMSGNGGQFCIVIPEKGIVLTKINPIDEGHKPFRGVGEFSDFITQLIR